MSNRVGILTFHFSDNNYGALLQTYASFVHLRGMGLNPTVINLLPSIDKSPPNWMVATVYNILSGRKEFEAFRKRFLKRTAVVKSYDECERLNSLFDLFFVGSDQVWRPRMARDNLHRYFLDFAHPGKKKIAYAASFGSEVWEGAPKDREEIKRLLSDFDAISVREDSGVGICHRDFEVEAVHVLDPTLLLKKEDYRSIELDEGAVVEDNSHKKLVFYLLDDVEGFGAMSTHIRSVVSHQLPDYWRVYNLYGKVVNLLIRKIFRFSKPGVWLSSIKNSDLVITDSFHCMLFSIIYRRDFICLINKAKGAARIESMLRYLGLEDRIAHSDNLNLSLPSIDYSEVEIKLEKLRESSLNFLEQLKNNR